MASLPTYGRCRSTYLSRPLMLSGDQYSRRCVSTYSFRTELTAIFRTSFCVRHRRWYDFTWAFTAVYLPRTLLRLISSRTDRGVRLIFRAIARLPSPSPRYVSIFTRSSKLKCVFLLFPLFVFMPAC